MNKTVNKTMNSTMNSTIEKKDKEKKEFSFNEKTLPPLQSRADGTVTNRAKLEQMEQLKENIKQGKVFVCKAEDIEMYYEAYSNSEHYKEWERKYYEDNPHLYVTL